MKKCFKCGKQFNSDVKFCPICGAEDNVIKINKPDFYKCPSCGISYSIKKNRCDSCGYCADSYDKEVNKMFEYVQSKQSVTQRNIPHCPTCNSTNIQKIGTGERMASVIGLGILSKKINKTWKCKNCGYTW